MDVKSTAVDDESSEKLENAGFSFEAWTVDDTEELDRLEDFDCKGITTNILTEDAIENESDN